MVLGAPAFAALMAIWGPHPNNEANHPPQPPPGVRGPGAGSSPTTLNASRIVRRAAAIAAAAAAVPPGTSSGCEWGYEAVGSTASLFNATTSINTLLNNPPAGPVGAGVPVIRAADAAATALVKLRFGTVAQCGFDMVAVQIKNGELADEHMKEVPNSSAFTAILEACSFHCFRERKADEGGDEGGEESYM